MKFIKSIRYLVAIIASPAVLLHAQTYSPDCPSKDIRDIMKDPVVKAALDKAWVDSMEGTPNETEAGGVVEQCRGTDPSTRKRGYYTRIRWATASGGGRDSLNYNIRPDSPGGRCRTVALFHTHPGPANDPVYDNSNPSPADIQNASNSGLPGIIRYGSGPDPTKTDTIAYRDKSATPRKMAWECTPPSPPPPPPSSTSLSAMCGEGASDVLKIPNTGTSERSFRAESNADWLEIATSGEKGRFTVPPGQEGQVSLLGACGDCCAPPGPKRATVNIFETHADGSETLVTENTVTLECKPGPDQCGGSSGDPHLCTHDRLMYDFQGVGEFVLSKTKDFEAQARFIPVGESRLVSVNGAVAARFGDDRVALYAGQPVRLSINGNEIEEPLDIGESFSLPSGLRVEREKQWYRFSNATYAVEAMANANRLGTILVRVPKGSGAVGLLGDRDGERDNDIRTPAGESFAKPLQHGDLYGKFGNAWRVTGETSLFDYLKGESAETFADLRYPERASAVRNVSAETRKKAEAVCRQAGVNNAFKLEDCIFDIAVTGDETFAADAAAASDPVARLEVSGAAAGDQSMARGTANGLTLSIPSVLKASYPVEVRISGVTERNYRIRIVPAGAGPAGRATNPSSTVDLKGGETSVLLRAPYPPGDYELLYVSPGNRSSLLSVPFRVVAPRAEIFAPETAEAGKHIDVRVVGEISPHTKINIVPFGSPTPLVGDHAFLKGDGADGRAIPALDGSSKINEESVRVPLRHAKSGKYEIQYVSETSHVVYARRPLTIK